MQQLLNRPLTFGDRDQINIIRQYEETGIDFKAKFSNRDIVTHVYKIDFTCECGKTLSRETTTIGDGITPMNIKSSCFSCENEYTINFNLQKIIKHK